MAWSRRSNERISFWGANDKRNRRKRSRRPDWLRFMPLWLGAIGAGLAYGGGWLDGITARLAPQAGAVAEEARVWAGLGQKFGLCHTGGGTNCVVDGDTIWLEGQNIRIADIDAPETHDYRCRAEKRLGDRATRRLHELVNSGPVTLQSIGRDQDSYGRKLRIVLVNGSSVGDRLVDEGLARYYGTGRRPWC